MWKFITRGIRESLERRVCRTNVYSQPINDETSCNETKPSVEVKNSYLETTKYQGNNRFCGFFNYRSAKDKKHYSYWGKCTERAFSDVLGWSSILAFGWVLCQTSCIRKHIFERNRSDKLPCRFSLVPGTHVSHVLNHTIGIEPKHILPVTNCIANSAKELNNENDDWLESNAYGPITVEKALEAAKDDFLHTHRIVMGEFELQFGMKALGEKKYQEAIEHFSTGAKLSSPGSMFNLGLCHELGIGTRIDTSKAAKYYHEAAEKGHAGAMYNLGVFHAQGRGGLPINLNEARDLFTKAAGLGQHEAQQALNRDKKMQEVKISNHTSSSSVPFKQPENIVENKSHFFSTEDEFVDTKTSNQNSNNYEYLYPRNRIENHTDMFLNFLGIKSNSVPILMEAAK